jgi:hypothetical protein
MTGLRLVPGEVLELPRRSLWRALRVFVSGAVFFGAVLAASLFVWIATGSG